MDGLKQHHTENETDSQRENILMTFLIWQVTQLGKDKIRTSSMYAKFEI